MSSVPQSVIDKAIYQCCTQLHMHVLNAIILNICYRPQLISVVI